MSEKLPPKEAGIFKKIVRSYECKQYKNGLKFAKQVLSNPKCADHGETLAMKGLILNCVGRKEEAYELVKRGLRNDLKSHVCWHVFGLLQRSDRKYDEAIKAYRNALKWDKDNLQILRDLSLLQLQMRNLEGFRETRYQLLKLRPTQRGSWVGYILGYHLVKDYYMALKVIAAYRDTQSPGKEKPDYEYSEMVLYEAQLMMESGKPDEALQHISEFREYICDDLAVKETLAEIYLEKGNLKEAQKLYYELVKRNTEYRFYYQQLERCTGLDCDAKRLRLYVALQEKFPYSGLLKRLPMECATGDEFRGLVKVFLKNAFLKGVPSIFVRLKEHYLDKEKGAIIGSIAEEFLQTLETCGKLCPEDPETADPSVELWVVHFLAQHCDMLGQTAQAVALIDRAILHTPTLPELFMTKAKIFKHGGDDLTAAQMMEEAQSLDTADRFVTSKCCKYLMRVNHIDRAVELVSLFTREGLPPLETLNDMQCNWFEMAIAKAYLRLGRVGDALKKCHQIDKHFSDIIDDQFDFHSYCMRKMTLRPYVRMLLMEDRLRGHPLYFDAAKLAMEIYLHLHDNPVAKQQKNGPQEEESAVSKVERKKMEKKQRKAQLKAQNKAQDEKKDQGKSNDVSRRVDLMAEKDDEFKPEQLETTEKPLEEALRFLKPLQLLAISRIETHLYAYRIHSKRGKFLLMLQAIRRAHAIDGDRPELHEHIVDFCCRVEENREQLGDVVLAVIDQTLPDMKGGGQSLIEFNEDFIQKHRTSLPHVMIGCKVMVRLQPSQVERAVGMMADLDAIATGCSVQVCSDVCQLLKDGTFGDTSVTLSEFQDKCHALFPLAVAFMPQSKLPQQQEVNSCEDKENEEPPLGAASN